MSFLTSIGLNSSKPEKMFTVISDYGTYPCVYSLIKRCDVYVCIYSVYGKFAEK